MAAAEETEDATGASSDVLDDELDAYDLVDEDKLTPESLEGIVQYTLDWSVQSLLERIGTTFDVNPSFQRRDAWSQTRKSLYIESLMLGLPVPQVVLAESGKGRFIVLDGKQRLITLKQFADPNADFKEFRLRRLEFLSALENRTFAELEQSLDGADYAASLLAQPIRTIVVRNWNDPAVLYQIFVRLNQNSVALSPQELRQALHPGVFTTWINERSRVSAPIHRARRLPGEDFRMRDAEMLLRFVAWNSRLRYYGGNLRAFLDETCAWGNGAWADVAADMERGADDLERAIAVTFAAFQEDSFRRFDGDKYVRRFNIAVFDAMSIVFAGTGLSEPDVDVMLAGQLRREYEQLIEENEWFRDSLISTTKSPRNTFGRIALWGRAVERATGELAPIAAEAEDLAARL